MFISFSTLLHIVPLAAVAIAAPGVLNVRQTTTTGDCNTGDQYCCQQVTDSNSTTATSLAGLLGISLAGLDVPVGLTCDPLTVIGLGTGSTCTQQPVCCTGNSYNGLIVVGCSPLNVGL